LAGCGNDALVDEAPDWHPAMPAADKSRGNGRGGPKSRRRNRTTGGCPAKLARLSRLEYEQRRGEAAK